MEANGNALVFRNTIDVTGLEVQHSAMLRLVSSIVLGALVGVAVALFCVKLLGITLLFGPVAYEFSGVVGLLVGLVAGTPVWKPGARLEAVLKAMFGAAMAIGLTYMIRRWVAWHVDLSSLGLGSGEARLLPEVVFPTIAVVLATWFGVDSLLGSKTAQEPKRLRVPEQNVSPSVPIDEPYQPVELEENSRKDSHRQR